MDEDCFAVARERSVAHIAGKRSVCNMSDTAPEIDGPGALDDAPAFMQPREPERAEGITQAGMTLGSSCVGTRSEIRTCRDRNL